MGTTHDKFSLTTIHDGFSLTDEILPNETLRLIGDIFEEVGFTVFVATFTPWCVGYDCEFVRLKDVKGKIPDTDRKESVTVNICISI